MVTRTGTDGNDTLTGTDQADLLLGLGGSDDLFGAPGNDTLNPGGNDGANGGFDLLRGSSGSDTYDFSDVSATGAYGLTYATAPDSGIVVRIDGAANTGSVVKTGGAGGTDTLVDVIAAIGAGGLRIDGSAFDDSFTFTGGAGGVLRLLGGEGADSYEIDTAGGLVLDFDAPEPVAGAQVDLAAGRVTDDGFGNAETLNVSAGTLTLRGTALADTLVGDAGDTVFILGQGRGDSVDGGAGLDTLSYARNGGSDIEVDLEDGLATGRWDGESFRHDFSNIETVQGSLEGDDEIIGDDGANRLIGSGGDDTLEGAEGQDTLDGGDDDDFIDASGGTPDTEGSGDFVLPGFGNDRVNGNSVLFAADQGIDVSYANIAPEGGLEFDWSDNGLLEVDGEDVNDTVTFTHSIEGSAGADSFTGTDVEDVRRVFWNGSAGDDTLTANTGDAIDILTYASDAIWGGTGGVDVTLSAQGTGTATDSFGDTDSFSEIERVETGAADDRLTGSDGDDFLAGGGGTDRLIGGLGNDTLYGGSAAGDGADRRDLIFGGAGNDVIDGGRGNDELRGDAGNDVVAGGFGADTVIGGTGNDSITGGALGDLLFGGDGADFVNGGFGFDRMNGGAGADEFFHLGIADHGSDWVQDYSAVEGDTLIFGQAGATRDQFQINYANTADAGDNAVEEAFIIYRPTGQILWALVDGAGQEDINITLDGQTFDLAI